MSVDLRGNNPSITGGAPITLSASLPLNTEFGDDADKGSKTHASQYFETPPGKEFDYIELRFGDYRGGFGHRRTPLLTFSDEQLIVKGRPNWADPILSNGRWQTQSTYTLEGGQGDYQCFISTVVTANGISFDFDISHASSWSYGAIFNLKAYYK